MITGTVIGIVAGLIVLAPTLIILVRWRIKQESCDGKCHIR